MVLVTGNKDLVKAACLNAKQMTHRAAIGRLMHSVLVANIDRNNENVTFIGSFIGFCMYRL